MSNPETILGFVSRYPALQQHSDLFTSLQIGGLHELEASVGQETLEAALETFVAAAHKVGEEIKAEYGVEPKPHPSVGDLKLLLDKHDASPEDRMQLTEALLLGAACAIYRKQDWETFCREKFLTLDPENRQSTLDGMKLWYANITHLTGLQYNPSSFILDPSEMEEMKGILSLFKDEVSPTERAHLTNKLFEAADLGALESLDLSQDYPTFVSQLFTRVYNGYSMITINNLCSRHGVEIKVPEDASSVTLWAIGEYLSDALSWQSPLVEVRQERGYAPHTLRPIPTRILEFLRTDDHCDEVWEIEDEGEREAPAVHTEHIELGGSIGGYPKRKTNKEYQCDIDAIAAQPESEKYKSFMVGRPHVPPLEIERRFGRCGFTFEEREALSQCLRTDALQGLKIMQIKEAMHELCDRQARENQAEGLNYQEQIIPSAIALVNIFGSDWRKWLDVNAECGIGAHDATQWLPSNHSPEQLCGKQGNSETKGVPALGEFLLRHRWNHDGNVTTHLVGRKLRKGVPREIAELSVIAHNWDVLGDADKQRSFTNVLGICRTRNYKDVRHQAFAEEAAFHGIKKEDYRDAETLYLSAQNIPEPFDTNKRFQVGGLTGRFLPRGDVRTGFFGEYVDCCQHLQGDACEAAASTMADPYSQLFAVEDAKGNIVGGAMVWQRLEPVSGHPGKYAMSACFDSVEMKGITTQVGVTEESERTEGIRKRQGENTEIHRQLAKWLTEECGFKRVTMATAYNTLDKGYLATLPALDEKDNLALPPAYWGRYSDAKEQYLIEENDKPRLMDGVALKPEVWVRGVVRKANGNGHDKTHMNAIAEKVYPEGFRQADEADSGKKTTYVLLRNHPDSAKKSGVIGYAVLDDEKKYIVDLAVDPECRRDSLKLLKRVFDHCEELGGTWSAHARESTTLKLLETMERRGRIRLHRGHDPNELAEGDVAHAISFEIVPREKAAVADNGCRPTCAIEAASCYMSPTFAPRANNR